MSRPLRIEYPGAWYHVMNRGLNRRLIFSDREDYPLFLETLSAACSQFHVGASAYCLMPNHYHALVHTPEGNLSRFMRHLNGVYTQRYNRKYRRDGPLFRGRFKGILIQEDAHLLQAVKYIHLNPLKAGLADSLKKFSWSSHKHFVMLRRTNVPEWLNTDVILGFFADRRSRAVTLYKQFMQKELDEEVLNFYSKKYRGPILGEKSFVNKIKEMFIGGDQTLDMELAGQRAIRGIERVRRINIEICRAHKIPESALFKSRRGGENIPRQMAILLAKELSGLRLTELAEAYKASAYKTVASSCYRLQRILEQNKKLAKQYGQIKKLCSQAET